MNKKTKIETYLSTSYEEGLMATRWLFRQEYWYICKALKEQQKEFFHLKKINIIDIDVVDMILISLINTAFHGYRNRSKTSPDSLKVPIKRESHKRKWLLDHQSVVRELCMKHASSRVISNWIRTKYRMEISHTMINQFIKEKGWKE